MPVELTITESTVTIVSATAPGPAGPAGADGAPDDATYLTTTAHAGLSAEVVVGATPGGELGGTWASPTVDATHSGSSHASVQAAAEATAAAALTSHESDTTNVHGIVDTSALLDSADIGTSVAAQSHAHAGEDITSGTVADARIASTIARDSEVTSAISALSTVYQPLDSDLTAVAGLSPSNDDVVQRKGGAWTNRTVAQLLADLAAAGTTFQPLDSDLTAIAALTTAAGGRSILTLADPNADRLIFWDDSAGVMAFLTLGTNLTITGTTLDATGGGSTDAADIDIADAGGFYTGTDVEAALQELGPAAKWTEVIKASDESVSSNTTVQNDDELFFTATSGAAYELDVLLIYGSPAGAGTPDLKFDLGEDATLRGVVNFTGPNTSDTVTTIALGTNQSVGAAGGAAADRVLRLLGQHVGGGGTFRLRWSQNTSNVNAMIMRAGSRIRYRRIN